MHCINSNSSSCDDGPSAMNQRWDTMEMGDKANQHWDLTIEDRDLNKLTTIQGKSFGFHPSFQGFHLLQGKNFNMHLGQNPGALMNTNPVGISVCSSPKKTVFGRFWSILKSILLVKPTCTIEICCVTSHEYPRKILLAADQIATSKCCDIEMTWSLIPEILKLETAKACCKELQRWWSLVYMAQLRSWFNLLECNPLSPWNSMKFPYHGWRSQGTLPAAAVADEAALVLLLKCQTQGCLSQQVIAGGGD